MRNTNLACNGLKAFESKQRIMLKKILACPDLKHLINITTVVEASKNIAQTRIKKA